MIKRTLSEIAVMAGHLSLCDYCEDDESKCNFECKSYSGADTSCDTHPSVVLRFGRQTRLSNDTVDKMCITLSVCSSARSC